MPYRKQILTTLGVIAVTGVAGLGMVTTQAANGNIGNIFSNQAVSTALQNGDLNGLKSALTAEANSKYSSQVDRINKLTDSDLTKMKNRQAEQVVIEAKSTEYNQKLTDILKADINNKEGFKTTAKEYFEAVKTLHQQSDASENNTSNSNSQSSSNSSAQNNRPERNFEITDDMLNKMYDRAVTEVKAGNNVNIQAFAGGKSFGGGHQGGKRGDRGITNNPNPNSTGNSQSTSSSTPNAN